MPDEFYGAEVAAIHDAHFGEVAAGAARLVADHLRAAGIERGTVVDLGCGSGILAAELTRAGFDVLGVDVSQAMLEIAAGRAPEATFVCESLFDVELPPAVAVAAIGETLDYAADPRASVRRVADLIARIGPSLDDRGVLVFDVAVPGRGGPTGTRNVAHVTEEWVLLLDAREDAATSTETRTITLFTKAGDLYRRSQERHVLRLYDPEDVSGWLRRGGFDHVTTGRYGAAELPASVCGFVAVPSGASQLRD